MKYKMNSDNDKNTCQYTEFCIIYNHDIRITVIRAFRYEPPIEYFLKKNQVWFLNGTPYDSSTLL